MAADLQSAVASLLQVPGMQELLNQSITQQRQLAPVRTAVAQHAMNTMPASSFGASGRPDISAIAPATYTTPAPAASGGFDLMSLLKILGLGGAGALAAKKLLSGNGSGAGGNLSSLGQALKKLVGGGGGGKDTGPASIPGGSSDFNDWAANTNTPNPEANPWQQPNWGNLPGASPMLPSWPETSDPFAPVDWSQLSGGGSDPNAGGSDYGGEDW